ncbi:MAG TPA: PD-(D/E)XK nuclease family protein [Acidimicrobiales bacterium]|nr:PD-(D/E)XK nuclease family protein [Acidimicrobiales bacterium]
MSFELPRSLSPSKVTSFRDCALAFRFSAIERLPEPSSPAMVKGTLVHSALERLFWFHERGARSESVGLAELSAAWGELQSDPEFASLGLTPDEAEAFREDGATLVRNYFRLEDPNEVRAVGMELTLDAKLGGARLRGIIDRLDLTDDGELVVIDYKTGRAPSEAYEQSKLVGVHIYALLCEELLGRRPVRVELLHLREPTVITAEPSDQTIRGHRQRTVAVWSAIERACRDEDFRPKTGPLCKYCHFRSFCPAFGGDPEMAAVTMLPAPMVAPPIVREGAA